MKKIDAQEAVNVLSTWIAFEVLSPQSFKNPKDLLIGNNQELILLSDNDSPLPWESYNRKNAKPGEKVFYQIIMGTVDLERALKGLLEKYTENGEEFSPAQGQAIIGFTTVDQDGCLLKDDTSTAISSFAWGMPQALKGELKDLSEWQSAEKSTTRVLRESLQQEDNDGQPLPLGRNTLEQAYKKLVGKLELPQEMLINRKFAIRVCTTSKKPESLQPPLLNSFYLNDLIRARSLVKQGEAPENLLRYLGVQAPAHRHNLLEEEGVLEKVLAPEHMPAARWPGAGRHPLVLFQQAAVNLAANELKKGGILAVNGPPGTGKTTLLRDIIAEVVTQRAEALSHFEDPRQAFIETGQELKINQDRLRLYKLDEKLKGFEIVIASSNNKAVENISAELPNLNAIAKDADELRYFNTLSDELLGCKTWGLISAVLGNASKRYQFFQKFWWDKEVGLQTYLAEASGLQQLIEKKDPETGKKIEKIPRIIEAHKPPRDRLTALTRWQAARTTFKEALKKSKEHFLKMQRIKGLMQEILAVEETLTANQTTPEELLLAYQKRKPNIIARFLMLPSFLTWKSELNKLTRYFEFKKELAAYDEKLLTHVVNKQSLSSPHEEKQQISPWCDAEAHRLRDELFITAIKLHKAFIDAAAHPLRQNLGILMRYFGQMGLKKEIAQYMQDLWSSFFLVVPSVSTTFASLGRMLGGVPLSSLGWLLIDEAGQALPQAAVAAMMRTKRAVVTGDPLQIEPVVTLPSSLTKGVCEQFGVDADRFNAPEASVQTLADTASAYFSEFHTQRGSRTVGVPLLVHRRCADPMFSISNAVAYERLMVQAKHPNSSLIQACLGPSAWFDVQGVSKDKWCPAEGKKVCEILEQLKNASVAPDFYIVSPFKVVAENLRWIIKQDNVLSSWLKKWQNNWVDEHVGTVHTVQGREAEAVFLVLGSPMPDQRGARLWAGRTPNLLNVSVTRAKEVLYVIGNAALWREAGVFQELYDRIQIV